MTTINDDVSMPVEATDVLKQAIEAAQARVREVYVGGRSTLIDTIPEGAWATWHLEEEMCLVADTAGLDEDEFIDVLMGIEHAA